MPSTISLRTALGLARQTERAVPRSEAILASVLAGLTFGGLLVVWLAGGAEVDVPWAPTLDLRLAFALDGLGALYALLASGVGAVVFAYSIRYLPLHLRHMERPVRDGRSFYALLVLFMASMIGLATAQDLIVIFFCFDLTAVCSYFLIGFDRSEAEARWGALMALVVTGITAVLLLLAAVILYAQYGTFSVPELASRVQPGAGLTVAGILIAVAALAKSAQVPFHFWLRRAMVAPTPISAYLHSAAMVAAGVLVLGRLYPLLAPTDALRDGLVVAGFASALFGGALSLAEDRLKPILAYSTVAQYGYVVALYGLGGPAGATAAALYVLMHGMAKSALFLIAGAVTEATGGEDSLRRLGGLWRSMPILAAAGFVAVAAVAALPLTLGFFADELFFKAALARGPVPTLVAVVVAALTFVYMFRFWARLFLGPRETDATPLPLGLVLPPVLLALVLLVGGLAVGPFEKLAEAAGAASLGAPAPAAAAYHLDLRATNLLALATFLLGGAGLWLEPRLSRTASALAALGGRIGPERLYAIGLRGLNRLSDRIHDIEVRDLRTRVAAVILPGAGLILLGALITPTDGRFRIGSVSLDDLGLVAGLMGVGAAALAATRPKEHLPLALTLSAAGFALAAVYALLGAPDVALVAVLVEITLSLVFIATLGRLPRGVLRREADLTLSRGRRVRDAFVGAAAGLSAFFVVWSITSAPSPRQPVAADLISRTDDAHAKDVVTAILADFRALDTLGEITVLAIALVGLATLFGPRQPA